ncbi:MAG: hypothetical protein Q4A67_04175 [Aerococcus sp.]|nr:hypothetical protein [Aerococcus sp.]
MTILTLGSYASALSAIISVVLLLYRSFVALERLVHQINELSRTVGTLNQKHQQLERAVNYQGDLLNQLIAKVPPFR